LLLKEWIMYGPAKRTTLTALVVLLAVCPASPEGPVTNKSLGSEKAPITMQVFSDFACPACAAFHLHTLRPLIRDYVSNGKVLLTFYVIPPRQRLPAYRAACYANAAARCGQFEKVADALYQNRQKWIESGDVEPVVAEVLTPEDLKKVKAELRNNIDLPLENDLAAARWSQIRSTPTTIITCRGKSVPVVGAVSYSILRLYLDKLLEEQE
jgi:protein-disulfide isomerase